MNTEKKFCVLLCSLLTLAAQGVSGQTSFTNSQKVWHEGHVNELYNLGYNSMNPTRLSYNLQKNAGEAVVNYQLGRGKYCDIDQSEHKNNLSVYLGGLKHLNKIDIGGFLKYDNISARDTKWNSTLYLNTLNPFVLCDSVASDATTESFQMEATLSYLASDRIKAGLSIGLTVGSASDQTDPRPKTNTAVFPVTAGIDYQVGKDWSVGASAQVRLLSSSISYTIINPLVSHRYFLMKGMGDYFRRSSSEESGYKRDYKGTTYKGALQASYLPANSALHNYVELTFEHGTENATDGGSAYTFKGGDFAFTTFGLTERLLWQPAKDVMHNIILKGSYGTGNGDWFDQKKQTDTEHGNMAYYEVLSKTRIHKYTTLSANAEYRFDKLKEGLPDFNASLLAGVSRNETSHFCDDGTHKQEYTNLTLIASAAKAVRIARGTLTAQLHGGYVLPLLDRKFDTGRTASGTDDITTPYVTKRFEYLTSKHFNVGGMLDYNIPVSTQVKLGVYGKVDTAVYNDDGAYFQQLKSTSYTTVDMGLYLNF